ncbi:hypothetical protein EDC01DRAFT_641067 [Geopyxis carbonaria]|nr:hypothetical protein EDC01DRAFT_641067 [Geopyxis carbonaria]
MPSLELAIRLQSLLLAPWDAIQRRLPTMRFSTSPVFAAQRHNLSLDAAGLVAIADLAPIAVRTAITGSASLLDVLVLAPGIHTQQSATELHRGEYPATGALTSGYVFRIENQATVRFLQAVGTTGHLTSVRVSAPGVPEPPGRASALLYLCCPALTLATLTTVTALRDWWALGVLAALMFARLLNVGVVHRRSREGWKGAREPGDGDLLVLLSQDRWVRLRGAVDDLKAVTSGEWLRPPTGVEDAATALATMLVYMVAALAGNATSIGNVLFLGLLPLSAALLGGSNACARCCTMYGRVLVREEPAKRYERRLDLVRELVAESGRDDWAVGLGMIPAPAGSGKAAIM